MKSQFEYQSKMEQKVIYTLLLIGILLPLFQFLANRSLWYDEALLALNIVNRNSIELFQPLDYEQVAPILFLELEKLFSAIVPNSEYGLRIVPLLCFWFSLFFFFKILKIILKDSISVCLGLSMFIFNFSLVYFSSEVKQYMVDVFMLTSVYYFVLKSYKIEVNKFYLLAIYGTLCIFLSNVTPLVLFSVGLLLFYEYLVYGRSKFKWIAFLAASWLLGFSIYFFNFIHDHPSKDFMLSYWSELGAFMPSNIFSSEFYQFIREKFKPIFESLMPLRIDYIYFSVVFFLVGSILAFKRNKSIFILSLTPIILHLILSSLWLYPFHFRLALYILPLLIILISFGFEFVITFEIRKFKIQQLRFLIFIIPIYFLFVFVKNDFPVKKEEIKESLHYIQKRRVEFDKLYVFYGAQPAFNYYKQTQNINFEQVSFGSKNRKNRFKYIHELQKLKGRHWLLFSHDILAEGAFISHQLGSLGYEKIDSFATVGSNAFLYDLNPQLEIIE